MMRERTMIEEEDCDTAEEEVQRRLTAMRLLTDLDAVQTLMEKARSDLNALLMFPEAGEMREALRTVRRIAAEAECGRSRGRQAPHPLTGGTAARRGTPGYSDGNIPGP